MPKKRGRFEEGIENFAEEMEHMGKKLERRIDSSARKHQNNWNSHKDSVGVMSPILSSMLSLILMALFIWVLGFVNPAVNSQFLVNLRAFFIINLGLLFAVSVFMSFSKYFSRRKPKEYELFAPICMGVNVAFAFWIIGNLISLAGLSYYMPAFGSISAFLVSSSYWFFGAFVFIGYIVFMVKLLTGSIETKEIHHMPSKKNVKRLYRSGREKILGGVCGGIAEYLEVDPVLIRLIWVAGTFAFGSGILLYIIAWIIIPRNPNHKWN
jgi:phage shock protein C